MASQIAAERSPNISIAVSTIARVKCKLALLFKVPTSDIVWYAYITRVVIPSTLCKPQAGAADWAPLQMPPACDPLFNRMACGYQTPYEEAVRTFLEGPFHTAETQPLLDQWTAQITEAVAEAHGLNGKQLSVDEWGKALTDFQNRLEVLREEAENP